MSSGADLEGVVGLWVDEQKFSSSLEWSEIALSKRSNKASLAESLKPLCGGTAGNLKCRQCGRLVQTRLKKPNSPNRARTSNITLKASEQDEQSTPVLA
mmetsp:Transcript_58503/g.122233  ORF Transcript_58503/g.122233 Transcript_58503/m.122233 type:complete len:99 (-) Transcript_58503:1927-2223(-)